MIKLKEKRALSVAEAARYACVSRGTVESWLTRKLLPVEELPGRGNGSHRFRRIRLADLEAFLDGHYNQPAEKKKEKSENRKITLLPRSGLLQKELELET